MKKYITFAVALIALASSLELSAVQIIRRHDWRASGEDGRQHPTVQTAGGLSGVQFPAVLPGGLGHRPDSATGTDRLADVAEQCRPRQFTARIERWHG